MHLSWQIQVLLLVVSILLIVVLYAIKIPTSTPKPLKTGFTILSILIINHNEKKIYRASFEIRIAINYYMIFIIMFFTPKYKKVKLISKKVILIVSNNYKMIGKLIFILV